MKERDIETPEKHDESSSSIHIHNNNSNNNNNNNGSSNSINDKYIHMNEQFIAMASGYFNLVAIPLLIVSGCAIGFILVWAEDILVPFVIAVFFTYLLRPLVDLLSMPIGKCSRSFSNRKRRIKTLVYNGMNVRKRFINMVSLGRGSNAPASSSSSYGATSARIQSSIEAVDISDKDQTVKRRQYMQIMPLDKTNEEYVLNNSIEQNAGIDTSEISNMDSGINNQSSFSNVNLQQSRIIQNESFSATSTAVGVGAVASGSSVTGVALNRESSGGSYSARISPRRRQDLHFDQNNSIWDNYKYRCRKARLPRWMAVMLSLCIVMGIIVGLVVMITDAVQRFENENANFYEERMVQLANLFLIWLKKTFGVDGSYLLQGIASQIQLITITKSFLVTLVDTIAYTFVVMLFVCYMLLEETNKTSKLHPRHARNIDLEGQHKLKLSDHVEDGYVSDSDSSSETDDETSNDMSSDSARYNIDNPQKIDESSERPAIIREVHGVDDSFADPWEKKSWKENPQQSPRMLAAKSSYSSAVSIRRQIDNQIQQYLATKTMISFVVGFLTYMVLGPLLQVQMAHLFGFITFLANFIPNVGAVMATLLPLPIIALDPNQTLISALLAFLLPTTIHAIIGNVIEPMVFGEQMELHPVVVMLSLSLWFSIWGVSGAILSVPITAVIRIIVSNMTHPYAVVILRLLEGSLPGSAAFHRKRN